MGYRPVQSGSHTMPDFGSDPAFLRIDMIERLAKSAHAARLAHQQPPQKLVDPEKSVPETAGAPAAGFTVDATLATSIGLSPGAHAAVLRMLGFRQHPDATWGWKGRAKPRKQKYSPESGKTGAASSSSPALPKTPAPLAHAAPAASQPHNAFAALSALLGNP